MCCALAPLRQKYDSFSFPFPSSATRTTRPTRKPTCACARELPVDKEHSRSCPQKRSPSTTNVGAPKTPLSSASEVNCAYSACVSVASRPPAPARVSFVHRIHSHSQWRCAPQDRSCRALRPTARAVAHAKAGTRPHHAPVPRSPSSLGTCSNSGVCAAGCRRTAARRLESRTASARAARRADGKCRAVVARQGTSTATTASRSTQPGGARHWCHRKGWRTPSLRVPSTKRLHENSGSRSIARLVWLR